MESFGGEGGNPTIFHKLNNIQEQLRVKHIRNIMLPQEAEVKQNRCLCHGSDAAAHRHRNGKKSVFFQQVRVSSSERTGAAPAGLSSELRTESPPRARSCKARWKPLYLLFLEFGGWSSSNSPRLHVQKVAAPRRPHGAAPSVPPLSTALPRSSPTWLCLWARLRHFALLLSTGRVCGGESSSWHLLCAVPIRADTQ